METRKDPKLLQGNHRIVKATKGTAWQQKAAPAVSMATEVTQ